jgi:hypothetical protein
MLPAKLISAQRPETAATRSPAVASQSHPAGDGQAQSHTVAYRSRSRSRPGYGGWTPMSVAAVRTARAHGETPHSEFSAHGTTEITGHAEADLTPATRIGPPRPRAEEVPPTLSPARQQLADHQAPRGAAIGRGQGFLFASNRQRGKAGGILPRNLKSLTISRMMILGRCPEAYRAQGRTEMRVGQGHRGISTQ